MINKNNLGDASINKREHQFNAQARRTVSVPKAETTLIDAQNPNIIYLGRALLGSVASDPVWQICRITNSSNIYSIQYADAELDFTKIWNDRASYTYA